MSRISLMNHAQWAGRGDHFRPALFGAILFILIFLWPAPAAMGWEAPAGAKSLEDLVTKDTLVFAKCSGVERLLKEAESLDLFRLWNDSEVQAFLAEAREMIPEILSSEGGPELPFQEAWRFLKGEFALALSSHLTLFENGATPATAVALNLGSDREALMESLNGFLDLAVEMQNLVRERMEYRGLDIHIIGRPEAGLTVCYTTIENLLVTTLNRRYLQEIIDVHLDQTPPLSADEGFGRCLNRVGGDSVDMLAYVNFRPFIHSLKPFYPFEVEEWLNMLGLDGIQSVCMASSLEGSVSQDSLFIDCPGEKNGLLKSLSLHPVSKTNIQKAPPDTLVFFDVVFDPELLMKEVDGFIKNALPERYEAFRMELEEMKKMTGFDLEQDILAPLGSELTFFLSMPRTAGISMVPDFIFAISLEDEEGFSALKEKVFAMLEGLVEVADWTYEGFDCHHITPPDTEVPLSPAFTVEGGRLLLAGSPMTLKRYLKWVKKGEPGLDGSEDFKKAMAGVPEGASLIKYANLRRSVEMGYSMAAPFMPGVLSQTGLPLDAGMLPMTETVTDYISNATGYMAMDEGGILFSSRCSMGLGALFAAAVAAGDYLIENNLAQGVFARRTALEEGVTVVYRTHPLLDAAFTSLRGRDYDGAVRQLTSYLDGNPSSGPPGLWALTTRGDCLMRLERYAEAAEDYLKAAEEDRENRSQIYYNIARAYTKLNKVEEAINYLERAISAGHRMFDMDPELQGLAEEPRFQAFFETVTSASILMRDSAYADAESLLTDWIFNNPYHNLTPWALKNRGRCLMEMDRYEEAITDLEKAANRDEGIKPEVYYSIACACSLLDQKDRAVDYLKKAIKAGFDDLDLLDYDGDLDNVRDHPKFKALKWRC